MCALDYLETLDIDPDKQDENKRGWCQIKMMFQVDDRQTLQDLIDNNIITPEDQLTPTSALKAIQSTLKHEHFWHFGDEVLSDFRQELNEGTCWLINRLTNLINNCTFTNSNTKETLNIMLLVHAIKYHEARDWIRLQDQSTLTYQSLLNHCKLLEQRCEQYQKAQLKGRADFTTITMVSSVTSVHQDTVTTHSRKPNCTRCGYKHSKGSCPASGQQCYNCSSIGHYTTLCKKPRTCITTTLADLAPEDPVTDTAANQWPEATAGHPIEADSTGVPVDVLTTNSTGHPSSTAEKREALHHMSIRLVILHTFFQDHMQQKDN